MNSEIFYSSTYDSPLGIYLVLSSTKGIVCIASENETADWLRRFHRLGSIQPDSQQNAAVVQQLAAYFNGELQTFDLPLDLRGTTFQVTVWEELRRVPYGKTCSYRDIAIAIGRPGAARPVGGAVGANPVAIVVPCHRVIGTDGSLTGYGGGLWRKTALLALESHSLSPHD